MKGLKTVLRELIGLFVEDGRFALAILAWVSLIWLVLPRLTSLTTSSHAPILLIGLLAILIESIWRRARAPGRA